MGKYKQDHVDRLLAREGYHLRERKWLRMVRSRRKLAKRIINRMSLGIKT